MRLLIVKLLCFSLKEILRVGCIILRGGYSSAFDRLLEQQAVKAKEEK